MKKLKNIKKDIKGNACVSTFIVLFYVIFSILFFLFWFSSKLQSNLWGAIFWIIFGNFIIFLITQCLHYWLGNKKNYYKEWTDIVRSIGGILEMILYTISFATNSLELIVGYLIMKTISVWKPKGTKDDDRIEGHSTAVHRIAIVMSLIFSFIASYFLFQYLKSFIDVFPGLKGHFLF